MDEACCSSEEWCWPALGSWSIGFAADAGRHPVSKEHPRLLGSRERLQQLARERADAYQRVVRVAREQEADEHAKMVSMALVCGDRAGRARWARQAVEMAMKTVRGPIRKGHVPFGHDLARCCDRLRPVPRVLDGRTSGRSSTTT